MIFDGQLTIILWLLYLYIYVWFRYRDRIGPKTREINHLTQDRNYWRNKAER